MKIAYAEIKASNEVLRVLTMGNQHRRLQIVYKYIHNKKEIERVRGNIDLIKWEQVDNFSKYYISNTGIIINKYNKKLSQRKDKDGYMVATLMRDREGKYTDVRVHRMVAMAFIENPHDKPVVNHKDGIKDNNNVNNLEWMTVSENTLHSFENRFQLSPNRECVGVYHDEKLIGVYNSKKSCANFLGMNRNTFSCAIKRGEKIYDELVVKCIQIDDYIEHPLFNAEIVKDKSGIKATSVPVLVNGCYYENMKDASEATGISVGKMQWAINKGYNVVNGDVSFKRISRFEYLNR